MTLARDEKDAIESAQREPGERVLIIREHGTKMPADVGGNIYLSLADRKDISSIETQLRSFVQKRL